MPYGETKVYFDGSHYIAIPHTTRPYRPKRIQAEESIEVEEKTSVVSEKTQTVEENLCENSKNDVAAHPIEDVKIEKQPAKEPYKRTRKTTRKELFEELYKKSLEMRKRSRRSFILQNMRQYFNNDDAAAEFVDVNLQRKMRNLICRRIRMVRKANLQTFNYFCTFTYDSALHTEDSFQKGLRTALRNLSYRKGWKYMGVWERSPEKKRLHFHGLFYIPPDTIPGCMIQCNSYSFSAHKRQITNQSVYFLERFGRNDFESIYTVSDKVQMLSYIMKYLEKSGEKIVYSKGLPQFFISDIMDEDVVCTTGMEDKKLLLFDDFVCWDEGCYMGKVSPEVIAQMRKAN